MAKVKFGVGQKKAHILEMIDKTGERVELN